MWISTEQSRKQCIVYRIKKKFSWHTLVRWMCGFDIIAIVNVFLFKLHMPSTFNRCASNSHQYVFFPVHKNYYLKKLAAFNISIAPFQWILQSNQLHSVNVMVCHCPLQNVNDFVWLRHENKVLAATNENVHNICSEIKKVQSHANGTVVLVLFLCLKVFVYAQHKWPLYANSRREEAEERRKKISKKFCSQLKQLQW